MAPFDVPHVTHDMMLRFMDVNFTAIVDGSAKIPSTIGTIAKPIFVEDHNTTPASVPAKTPEQDKAMWEGLCFPAEIKGCRPVLMICSFEQRITTRVPPRWYSYSSSWLSVPLSGAGYGGRGCNSRSAR